MYRKGLSRSGVVITHPHPLFGGDMDNPVVMTLAAAYQGKGYATLRFNFRGVGESGGRHDNGRGETNDVIAAIEYLSRAGIAPVDLAGYSFGAWVNARVAAMIHMHDMVMVAPPVSMMDFQSIDAVPGLSLVLTGTADDIAPPERIRTLLPAWNETARLEVIDGADHFYSTGLPRLKAAISAHVV